MELTTAFQRIPSIRSFSSSFDEDASQSVTGAAADSTFDQWSHAGGLPRLWELLCYLNSVNSVGLELAGIPSQYTAALCHLEGGTCRRVVDDRQMTVRLEPEASYPIEVQMSREPKDFKIVLELRDR
jgi:hypothetical protein